MTYPSAPQQPSNNKTTIIAAASAVAVVAAIGSILVWFLAFGGSDSGGSASSGLSPNETIEEYVKLQEDGEYAKSLELCSDNGTQRVKENWGGGEEPSQEYKDASEGGSLDYEYEEAQIDGDKATVKYTENLDGQESKGEINLVNQDGTWLIDDFKGY